MLTSMPSSSVTASDRFFTLQDVSAIATLTQLAIPVVKGRVWGGDERNQTFSVECESFEGFAATAQRISHRIEFLAFDEMHLDEDTLIFVQEELNRYAAEENISHDLIVKALSAMRSHEGERYAVVAYAFLESGHVMFVRAQNELARFVHHPDRLLSTEGLSSVRKLKTLEQ